MKILYRKCALVLVCYFVILSACQASGNVSKEKLSQVIEDHTDYSEVTVKTIEQKYDDSFRSPSDAGTTYVVVASVKSSDDSKKFKIFISKQDGWANVKEENKGLGSLLD